MERNQYLEKAVIVRSGHQTMSLADLHVVTHKSTSLAKKAVRAVCFPSKSKAEKGNRKPVQRGDGTPIAICVTGDRIISQATAFVVKRRLEEKAAKEAKEAAKTAEKANA